MDDLTVLLQGIGNSKHIEREKALHHLEVLLKALVKGGLNPTDSLHVS